MGNSPNAKKPYLLAIPLKGINILGEVLPQDLFVRPWSLIGRDVIEQLAAIHGNTEGSLYGNVLMIHRRLKPTGFLLVRYFEEQQSNVLDDYDAELVLAAISMAILLSSECNQPTFPALLSRARYPEACDLPLSFSSERVISVGHTTRTGMVPTNDSIANTLKIELVFSAIQNAPQALKEILERPFENRRRAKRLANGIMAIQGAWQNLTSGGFVSSFMTACELMVDEGGDTQSSQTTWKKRVNRITACVGLERQPLVDRVANARHNYVHQSIQPDDEVPFRALALAIAVWTVVDALFERYKDWKSVELVLDCIYQNEYASAHGIPQFAASEVQSLAVSHPPWVQHWLDR